MSLYDVLMLILLVADMHNFTFCDNKFYLQYFRPC